MNSEAIIKHYIEEVLPDKFEVRVVAKDSSWEGHDIHVRLTLQAQSSPYPEIFTVGNPQDHIHTIGIQLRRAIGHELRTILREHYGGLY